MFKKLFKGKKAIKAPAPAVPKELSEITANLLELSRQYEEAQRKSKDRTEEEVASAQRACA